MVKNAEGWLKFRGIDRPWAVVSSVMLICWILAGVALARAETYSYADDQGTVAYTDDLRKIPPRYRPRAKVVHQGAAGPAARLTIDRIPFIGTTHSFTFAGLTPYQSRTLVLGFGAAIVMFAVMLLSSNGPVRLLMRWMLILLAIGTTAAIYFSNDPLTAKATIRAKQLEGRQQEKADQLERMDEPKEDR